MSEVTPLPARRRKTIAEQVAEQVSIQIAQIPVEEIARRAAVEALKSDERELAAIIDRSVNSALEKLGVDTQNADAMRADMAHLRQWREIMGTVRSKGLGAVLVALVSLAMTIFGAGVLALLHR